MLVFASTGTEIRTTALHFYDLEGVRLRTISQIDSTAPNLALADWSISATTTGNPVFNLKGSALGHDNSILWNQANIYLCDQNYQELGLTGEEIIQSDYSVEYIGSGTFTSILPISATQTTLAEYMLSSPCSE